MQLQASPHWGRLDVFTQGRWWISGDYGVILQIATMGEVFKGIKICYSVAKLATAIYIIKKIRKNTFTFVKKFTLSQQRCYPVPHVIFLYAQSIHNQRTIALLQFWQKTKAVTHKRTPIHTHKYTHAHKHTTTQETENAKTFQVPDFDVQNLSKQQIATR